ncbi:MAG: copper amine oxidase N-terminal domain-containing protein [Defluviitaleaceae bacterium]|nr:copper amine oxidase N-terminal domain-containing protein [Defluviitaleaceae bacterium]
MKKIFLATMIFIFATATSAFAIAVFDENGNIIENEPLEGGIVTLMLDLGADFETETESGSEPKIMPQLFGSVTGDVEEISEHFVRIKSAGAGDFADQLFPVIFVLDENTFLFGKPFAPGDKITGFFTTPAGMMNPPTFTPLAIVNHAEKPEHSRFILDRFDENWLSGDGKFRLNIGDKTKIQFQNGDAFEGEKSELVGRKLLVEFSISHRDFPETIPNPENIVVLYERAVHPIGEIDWDFEEENFFENDIWSAIEWDGYPHDARDWSPYDIIITINGLSRGVPDAKFATVGDSVFPNYVPLRAIAEMFGFSPNWNDATKAIHMKSPRGDIALRMGMAQYDLATPEGLAETYTLDMPIIIDGRTYVPLNFFSEVFGFNNAFFEGGNIFLDNFEKMN